MMQIDVKTHLGGCIASLDLIGIVKQVLGARNENCKYQDIFENVG
jgi:hypothetical protein